MLGMAYYAAVAGDPSDHAEAVTAAEHLVSGRLLGARGRDQDGPVR